MVNSDEQLQHRERHLGEVLWFNSSKGYGFVKPKAPDVNEGKDLFVHFHFIVQRGFKTLRKGDVVEFCVGKNANGPVAQEVKIITPALEETAT